MFYAQCVAKKRQKYWKVKQSSYLGKTKHCSMRSFFLLIGFIAASTVFSFAQEVKLQDESVTFSSGSQPAIIAEIPFGKRAIVEKQLKSELKSWGGKLSVSGDEYKVVQGKMKIFGDTRFDGYAKIIETADAIQVAFAIDMGGKYMSSGDNPIEYKTIRERVRSFGAKTGGLSIKADLDADKKALKALEKEEKQIEKSIESAQKDIESYQKKIKQAEKDIETKKGELSSKQEEIKTQNGQITERKKNAKKIK